MPGTGSGMLWLPDPTWQHIRARRELPPSGVAAAPAVETTLLTANSNAVDATSFATASVDPADDAVVWLHVALRHATLEPSTPTITGCGLTWTLVPEQNAGDLYFDTATTRTKHFVFRGHHATPTAGAITIDLGGVTHAGAVWQVLQQTNVNNPSAPVVQAASARGAGGTTVGTSGTVTFGGAPGATGAVVMFLSTFDNAAGAVTPEAGYSQVGFAGPEAGESNLSVGSYVDQVGADATPSVSWTTPALWGLVAVEVALVGAAGGPVPLASIDGAASDGTGALDVSKTFTSADGAASDGTGALAVARPLDAIDGAAADGVGSLSVARPLASIDGAAADGTAALNVAKTLVGIDGAAADGTAQLNVAKTLASIDGAAADGVGDLSISGSAVLASTDGAAADGTGSLTVARPLASIDGAAADGVGTLDVEAAGFVELEGISGAGADGRGALSIAYPLASIDGFAADGAGDLRLTLRLAAIDGAASDGIGHLTVTGAAGLITFGVNTLGGSSGPDGRGTTTPGKDTRGRTLVGVEAR